MRRKMRLPLFALEFVCLGCHSLFANAGSSLGGGDMCCMCVFWCLFVSCRVSVFCGHLQLLPALVEESWSKRKNVRSTFAVTKTWWGNLQVLQTCRIRGNGFSSVPYLTNRSFHLWVASAG